MSLCCAAWLCACGASQPGAANAKVAEPSAGPLIELLPPGPTFVLCARPQLLMQAEASRALWRTLVTEEREQAFRTRTGVDPSSVEELAVIEIGQDGYLLLARGPFDAAAVVRAAGDRLAIRDVEVEEPVLRREGLAGNGRYAYAVLDPHAVLVAKGASPALVAAVLGRLNDAHAPRLLDTPDAEALYAKYAGTPLWVLGPRPLQLEPGSAVALLMAEQSALAVSIVPSEAFLFVTIDLRGVFPEGVELNLRAWARSVGASDLGRALGLENVADRMGVQRDAEGVVARANVDAAGLLRGVRLLFLDGMREIFPGD